MGVRINWKHILVFVPMQIDGNIYFGGKCIFGHGDFGNLSCVRRILTIIMIFMHL